MLIAYFGDTATFKVEKMTNGFFLIYFDGMIMITKAFSLSPLVVCNRWLRFQLWNAYVEPTLEMFSSEDLVVQAHGLRPEWRITGIAKWIGNQIGMYVNTLESTETHMGPSLLGFRVRINVFKPVLGLFTLAPEGFSLCTIRLRYECLPPHLLLLCLFGT